MVQTGKTSNVREKLWTEAEAREALREWRESGLKWFREHVAKPYDGSKQ